MLLTQTNSITTTHLKAFVIWIVGRRRVAGSGRSGRGALDVFHLGLVDPRAEAPVFALADHFLRVDCGWIAG